MKRDASPPLSHLGTACIVERTIVTDVASEFSPTPSAPVTAAIPVRAPRTGRTSQSHSPTQRSTGPAEPALHELMSPEQNVQRIMWTGTIWFAAAIASVAIALGFLLSSGWRPADLPTGLRDVWWAGFAIVTLSIGLIGWSGCPILEVSVPTADRNKSRTMQFGTALFIGGTAITMFAVLLGPAS